MAAKKNHRRQGKGSPAGRKRRNGLIWAGAGVLGAVVVAIAVVAMTGDGGGSGGAKEPGTPVVIEGLLAEVDMVDSRFKPADIIVQRGTTVSWLNTGDLPHNVTEDRDRFKSENMSRGDEYAQTFDTPGEYFYYCTIHHAMRGSVVVNP